MKKTTENRINEITKYMLINQKATTIELSKMFNVSPEMIRRDLDFLEQRGTIERIHGGAILKPETESIPFSARIYQNKTEKNEICRKAIDYINDGDTVFIDPSTTGLQLGRLIKIKKDLTIVTNCISVLQYSSETPHEIILLGGSFSKMGDRTLGYFAVGMIKQIHFNVAFFGADGLKNMNGPGTISESELSINEAVIKNSDKNILLVDSTKFEKEARYVYSTFDKFDALITNCNDPNLKYSLKVKEIVVV